MSLSDVIAYKIHDRMVDLSCLPNPVPENALPIRTSSVEGLEILRHSCTHLMAQAVLRLYPQARLAVGPVIEDGFYYDIDLDVSLSENDFEKIESEMKKIVAENLPVQRVEYTKAQAFEIFSQKNEVYKVEIIENLESDAIISAYSQGEFLDLCKGPHVPSTAYLQHFRLTKISGAYWKGDQKNKMLQRIYGTCFACRESLEGHLKALEEAQKRDHRALGQKMELFHMQALAPGMIFWHPKGWTLYRLVEDAIRTFLGEDYLEVKTPQVVHRSLWEQSGHWAMFSQNMFQTSIEDDFYAIKPMNCPCHVQIFKQKIHSYKDLPLRLAEFGSCHRYEPSGALHGMMRLRQFTQDDAHIFCTPEQIQSEVSSFNTLLKRVYAYFGFDEILVKLSTRPEKRVGSDELWDQAEAALASALQQDGLAYEIQPGEGAFYGPKIEFQLKDCLNRKWQLGTIQLDFSMPMRLEAHYIDAAGQKQHPVMIHRAILGSIERFIAILLEHYAGDLPLKFAPIQFMILPISEKHRDYAALVAKIFKENQFRVEIDLRNEKIGYKIRDHVLKKIPYLIILGDQEAEQGTISLRTRQGQMRNHLTVPQLQDLISQEL